MVCKFQVRGRCHVDPMHTSYSGPHVAWIKINKKNPPMRRDWGLWDKFFSFVAPRAQAIPDPSTSNEEIFLCCRDHGQHVLTWEWSSAALVEVAEWGPRWLRWCWELLNFSFNFTGSRGINRRMSATCPGSWRLRPEKVCHERDHVDHVSKIWCIMPAKILIYWIRLPLGRLYFLLTYKSRSENWHIFLFLKYENNIFKKQKYFYNMT